MTASASSSLQISELSFLAKGLTPESLLEVVQTVAAQSSVLLKFESGSNITFQIFMPGTVMAEQRSNSAKTGDIIGSTVGSIGSARDVTVFQQEVENSAISADEKTALLEARRKLETLDLTSKNKGDVAADLAKLTEELKESQPEEGRLKRLLRNIKELAPPVASVLSTAASLHKLMN